MANATTRSAWRKKAERRDIVSHLLVVVAACFSCSTSFAQTSQPLLFSPITLDTPIHSLASSSKDLNWNADPFAGEAFGGVAPIDPTMAQMTTGDETVTGQSAEDAPVRDGRGGVDQVAPSSDGMPSVLTNPVLPNVPSSLNEDPIIEPPLSTGTGAETEPGVGSGDAAEGTGQTKEGSAQSDPQGSSRDGQTPGLVLHRPFSVLFTEQRPFLLYAKDASITYLMPNALIDHPALGLHLRAILEDRALSKWQQIRAEAGTKGPGEAASSKDRPKVVVNGRIEDRFASNRLSSLYMKETEAIGAVVSPEQVLSFNFDHGSEEPFSLADLFNNDVEKALDATIQAIAAYIEADIVRQKSIRLGTPISLEQDAWLKDLDLTLDLLNTFTLVPSREVGKIAGLAFHFNPGLLGALADGVYSVYVPSSIFAAALSDAYGSQFGGDALDASRHNAGGFSNASVNLDGLKAGTELGGDMLLEGEVPGNWCDGFHLTLVEKASRQIVTEGLVELLPDLPNYGLSGNMLRFRADISVTGNGGKDGLLVFEPFSLNVDQNRIKPRADSACRPGRAISPPDPERDVISIPVTF